MHLVFRSVKLMLGAVRSFFLLASITTLALGCATTINDSAPTTIPENGSNETLASNATVATIDPNLGDADLLTQMLQSVDALSRAMQNSDRTSATKHLDQILALTNVVRPRIVALSDQLAADLDRVVALAKSSVERNRPADADKALRFLPLIIDSLKNF